MSRTHKSSPPDERERTMTAPPAIGYVPAHITVRAVLEPSPVWDALEDLYLSIHYLGACLR